MHFRRLLISFIAILVAAAVYLSLAADPTLFEERIRPGGPTIDRQALRAIRLCAMAQFVIAICDIGRFHWSDTVPPSIRSGPRWQRLPAAYRSSPFPRTPAPSILTRGGSTYS